MPRPKTYVVILTDEQQAHLLGFLKQGAAKARMLTRARILLLSAAGNTDRFIADVLQVTPRPCGTSASDLLKRGWKLPCRSAPDPARSPNWTANRRLFS